MTDHQSYLLSVTLVMLYALYRVTSIAHIAVSRAIPDKGFKDL